MSYRFIVKKIKTSGLETELHYFPIHLTNIYWTIIMFNTSWSLYVKKSQLLRLLSLAM